MKDAAWGQAAAACISISPTRSSGSARPAIEERYGNLFEMYERITGEDPYTRPMRIYPAVHYTMGGLWVDYNLMSTLPGLHVIGEANFSDHGANRLGASALMQGLADGYFILPYTIGDYLATNKVTPVDASHAAFKAAEAEVAARTKRFLAIRGQAHRGRVPPRVGADHVGGLRHGAQRGGAPARDPSDRANCARSSGAT